MEELEIRLEKENNSETIINLTTEETKVIPSIGENDNWFINGVDTGKSSRGKDGEPGKSGVYVGIEEPIDENINIWINPDGEANDEIATKEYVDEALKNISGGGTIVDAQFNIIDGILKMEYSESTNVDFNINNNGELEVIM